MPVLALFTGKLTKAQYDTLRAEIDWENRHPAGGISHAASFDDNGQIHVADVWESADHLNAFAQNHLMPAFARHKLAPPSVAVYPAYRVIAYPSISEYRI